MKLLSRRLKKKKKKKNGSEGGQFFEFLGLLHRKGRADFAEHGRAPANSVDLLVMQNPELPSGSACHRCPSCLTTRTFPADFHALFAPSRIKPKATAPLSEPWYVRKDGWNPKEQTEKPHMPIPPQTNPNSTKTQPKPNPTQTRSHLPPTWGTTGLGF